MHGAHAAEPLELAGELSADLERGLDDPEAGRRLAVAGSNTLPSRTRPRYARIAARQLADPLMALLAAAAAVSLFVGDRLEALVIVAIVVVNAVLGLAQEAGAERAVLALRSAIRPTASVVRGGREREVAAAEVVPGDLVVVREGDRVPADARVTAHERLEVDESALTGESFPVRKTDAAVPADAPLAERSSILYAGTAVTRGRGRALVVATGQETELGRIAALSASARPPLTPLQRQLGLLSRAMVALGAAVTVVLTLGMLARDASFEEAFLVGVAVAVAAVPEGLAATVTIALAQGAHGMAARGAIVRRLGAVETLGAATVIAADKTGTLTVNQLRVNAVRPFPGRTEVDVLETAALASTAELVEDDHRLRVAGDPVDGAFLLALADRGRPDPRRDAERLRELPFDPWRKRLTTVYRDREEAHVVVKGAPEELAARSTLDETERAALLEAATAWADEGLRVLAVADRRVRLGELEREDELDAGLEIVGLAALDDPLRPAARASIASARRSGLRVLTLTGDHPVTAAAIARALELPQAQPVTGAELDALGSEGLDRALDGRSVFARVTPEHKLRLVEALQQQGEVVAVTGDGVNDTPALRRADVGVAMGESGTEAAREAADVVLTDDDFATIVAAIREGRRIADNIRNFVAFLLSANLGEVVLFAVAVLGGLGAPLTVVQVLTVNLLTDGLPAVALASDPASGAERPPRGHGTLFPRPLRLQLVALGLVVGSAALAAYAIGRTVDAEAARTMAFATLGIAELALVFAIRTGLEPLHRGPRNAFLGGAVVASLAVIALVVYLPAAHDPFGTTSLGPGLAAAAVAIALCPALLLEGAKAVLRRG